MRLFIGIPLPPAVVEELTALTERLKSPSDGLRWSAPAGWHITLQFLGKTSPEQYACLVPVLGQIRFSSFAIQLEPPGFFDRAGVFFAGVRLSPELLQLQEQVVAATRPCGFVPDDRPYHPHITLARSKAGRSALAPLKPRIGDVKQFSGFTSGEFLLYESFPDPGGSRYEMHNKFFCCEKKANRENEANVTNFSVSGGN